MIFHENRLLADTSHVISYLIFCRKLGKMSQNLSSAAVVGLIRESVFVPKSDIPYLPQNVRIERSSQTFKNLTGAVWSDFVFCLSRLLSPSQHVFCHVETFPEL